MNLESIIQYEAGNCVACGLCLPRCPTYRLLRDEAESPRGRISLMQALARGDLALNAKMETHLAHCLACRACERACPSNVAYGRLIDSTRALIETRRVRSPWQNWLRRTAFGLLEQPKKLERLGRLLRHYQRSGPQQLARATGILRLLGLGKLDAALPKLPDQPSFQTFYPAQGKQTGQVALLTGCVASLTDSATLSASIRLLTLLGYDVHLPADQACCGALHQHHGETEKATALMRRNIHAFAADQMDAVISTASGCGAMLREYPICLPGDKEARSFACKVQDISQFLAGIPWPSSLRLRPLHKRVAMHDPCTLVNVLRQEDKPYALLNRIPEIEMVPLPDNHQCCGAAGTYHLSQPELAQRLRAATIEHLRRLAPDILATSNIGCAMYLATGLRESGLEIEVVHPVVLIERQLQVASGK